MRAKERSGARGCSRVSLGLRRPPAGASRRVHAEVPHACRVLRHCACCAGARRDTKFKVTGVMVNMVNDATKDLNEADFAEDWPQCGCRLNVGRASSVWIGRPTWDD